MMFEKNCPSLESGSAYLARGLLHASVIYLRVVPAIMALGKR
jgi:hypothetical protein